MNFGNKSVLNSGAHRLAFGVGAKTTGVYMCDYGKVNKISSQHRIVVFGMVVR